MEENKEIVLEEIVDFPEQTIFNEDDMSIIVEEGEEDAN